MTIFIHPTNKYSSINKFLLQPFSVQQKLHSKSSFNLFFSFFCKFTQRESSAVAIHHLLLHVSLETQLNENRQINYVKRQFVRFKRWCQYNSVKTLQQTDDAKSFPVAFCTFPTMHLTRISNILLCTCISFSMLYYHTDNLCKGHIYLSRVTKL